MMNNKAKIDTARENWVNASKELRFEIITPYSIVVSKKQYVFFAFIPNFGSCNGIILDLISPPKYETNKDVVKIAHDMNCSYSFINIDCFIDCDIDYFREVINDWGRQTGKE